MQSDDPAFLTVGTEVSAKFKGAFYEAKVKKVRKRIRIKVVLKDPPFGNLIVDGNAISKNAKLEINEFVDVIQGKQTLRAVIQNIKDCSKYHVVFNDGVKKELRRTQLCLKSGKHFDAAVNLDALPLYNPDQFSSPVMRGAKGKHNKKRKGDESISPLKRKKKNDGEQDEEESDEEGSKKREGRKSESPKPLEDDIREQDPDKGYRQANVISHFYIGQKVRANHSGRWYNARIVEIRQNTTLKIGKLLTQDQTDNFSQETKDELLNAGREVVCIVHYLGWNSRFDEWVNLRNLKISDEDQHNSRNMIRDQFKKISDIRIAMAEYNEKEGLSFEKILESVKESKEMIAVPVEPTHLVVVNTIEKKYVPIFTVAPPMAAPLPLAPPDNCTSMSRRHCANL